MKIDIERLLCSLIECNTKSEHKYNWLADDIITSLRDQGLIYKDGQIIPKLRESEDEKIRKEIIDFLELPHPQFVGKRDHEKWIAWLEKQGKQKSIDNLTPQEAMDIAVEKCFNEQKPVDNAEPKLNESEDEKIRKVLVGYFKGYKEVGTIGAETFNGIPTDNILAWLEKQGSEPNWCHHKVDLSDCSEEYRKAYYDGWNNCNMQHSQCKSELEDVVKCLINGMKFYYEDNEEATWGTEKFSMKVKDILSWLEKQGEQKPNNHVQWSDEEELHIKELESLVKKVWAIAERENDKDTIREMSDLSFFLKTLNPEKKGEQRPNPYSGTSFEYNGHTWGMCARDNGVEILIDGHLKGRVFANDNNAKEMFIKALERVEEENAKGYKLTDCDKNSWWEDFKSYVSCTFEQKSADKIEPKFKQGEWIIFNGLILYVDEVVQGYYRTISIGGIPNSYDWDIDNAARLWTIQEAKAGDVLAAKSGNRIFLYNGDCDLRHRPCAYCGTYKGFSEILFSKCAIGNYFTDEDVYPATKKQRDLLFVKMKEAGYEWDAETKELNKIEPFDKYEGLTDFERTLADVCIGWIGEENGWKQYIRDNADILLGIAVKMFNSVQDAPFEQKPTWSEEDEKMLCDVIKDLVHPWNEYISDRIEEEIKWLKNKLKSLKSRVKPQPKEELDKELEELKGLNDIDPILVGDLAKGEDYGIDGLSAAIDILQRTLGKVDGYQTDDGILEHECAISAVKQLMAQKDAEKEEIYPETLEDAIRLYYDTYGNGNYGFDNLSLEKFKDIVYMFVTDYGKKYPAWSEDDEKILNLIIARLHSHPNVEAEEYGKDYHWLKSLKDRVQPEQEWSEEDERSIRDSIFYLKSAKKYFEKDDDILWDEKWFNLCIEWLESLYKKLRLQSQWKPSEEQMNALDSTLQYSQVSHNSFEYLNSLFNDLKKLREE